MTNRRKIGIAGAVLSSALVVTAALAQTSV
jgi:hypothetical protein